MEERKSLIIDPEVFSNSCHSEIADKLIEFLKDKTVCDFKVKGINSDINAVQIACEVKEKSNNFARDMTFLYERDLESGEISDLKVMVKGYIDVGLSAMDSKNSLCNVLFTQNYIISLNRDEIVPFACELSYGIRKFVENLRKRCFFFGLTADDLGFATNFPFNCGDSKCLDILYNEVNLYE